MGDKLVEPGDLKQTLINICYLPLIFFDIFKIVIVEPLINLFKGEKDD
ncbi:MAG: hypothetical protein AAB842_01410 [Patescibacteria group bacterium]